MDEKIKEYRAQVIEEFINLEWIINAIISQHYFGEVRRDFTLEVLYDEQCSFGLRRRILEKIIPDFDKTQKHNLSRLNTIRNYFAHVGVQTREPTGNGEKSVIMVPDPRKPGKAVDLAELYKEFREKRPKVAKYLVGVAKKLGVKFTVEEGKSVKIANTKKEKDKPFSKFLN